MLFYYTETEYNIKFNIQMNVPPEQQRLALAISRAIF